MFGTLVNVFAIVGGTLLGLLFKKGIPEKAKTTIFQAIGLVVIAIGLKMGLSGDNELILIVSLVLGAIIGEALDLDERLNGLGGFFYEKMGQTESTFIEGFVTASLIYSIGAMATLGPLEAGLNNNMQILYVKSMLDGITSILLGSSLGIGVAFSSLPVLVYQGGITLFAGFLAPFLIPQVIVYVSAVGGLLIAAIGFNMLFSKDIKVANLLPAIFVAGLVSLALIRYFPSFL